MYNRTRTIFAGKGRKRLKTGLPATYDTGRPRDSLLVNLKFSGLQIEDCGPSSFERPPQGFPASQRAKPRVVKKPTISLVRSPPTCAGSDNPLVHVFAAITLKPRRGGNSFGRLDSQTRSRDRASGLNLNEQPPVL